MTRKTPSVPHQLWAECDAAAVEPLVVTPTDPLYERVLAVASAAYGVPPSKLAPAEDAYSEIQVLMRGGAVVGTLSVTRAARGRMEAEEHVPGPMLDRYRARTCTAYRLAVDPAERPPMRLARLLMRLSFADGLSAGMRLAVVTSKPDMVGYYRRVGYVLLPVRAFTHPRLGTPHVLVACPADPSRPSMFRDLCTHLPDPLPLASMGCGSAEPAGVAP